MRLLNLKITDSSEDENSDEEMQETDMTGDSQPSEPEDEGEVNHALTADSELSDEGSPEDQEHPYPTPPPDADEKDKMAAPKQVKPMDEVKKVNKGTVLSWALAAIKALNNRSGSSVQAIVKYMKSTGYEVTDERRLARLVLKSLKLAVTKGEVTQVKRSFKLVVAKPASKSVEKMKAKAEKKQLTNKKEAKAQAGDTETVNDEKGSARKKKASASATKTNVPDKPKKNAKLIAVAGDAKTEAGVKAMAALEKAQKASKTTKSAKNAKATPEVSGRSPPSPTDKKIAKAKAKVPRKSIGTLAQPMGKGKIQVKAIKRLVAGKAALGNGDDIDSDLMDSEPIETSTPRPFSPLKQKRKGRVQK